MVWSDSARFQSSIQDFHSWDLILHEQGVVTAGGQHSVAHSHAGKEGEIQSKLACVGSACYSYVRYALAHQSASFQDCNPHLEGIVVCWIPELPHAKLQKNIHYPLIISYSLCTLALPSQT